MSIKENNESLINLYTQLPISNNNTTDLTFFNQKVLDGYINRTTINDSYIFTDQSKKNKIYCYFQNQSEINKKFDNTISYYNISLLKYHFDYLLYENPNKKKLFSSLILVIDKFNFMEKQNLTDEETKKMKNCKNINSNNSVLTKKSDILSIKFKKLLNDYYYNNNNSKFNASDFINLQKQNNKNKAESNFINKNIYLIINKMLKIKSNTNNNFNYSNMNAFGVIFLEKIGVNNINRFLDGENMNFLEQEEKNIDSNYYMINKTDWKLLYKSMPSIQTKQDDPLKPSQLVLNEEKEFLNKKNERDEEGDGESDVVDEKKMKEIDDEYAIISSVSDVVIPIKYKYYQKSGNADN